MVVHNNDTISHLAEHGNQFLALGLQGFDAIAQLAGHTVECLGELPNLVLAGWKETLSQVAGGHLLGCVGQFAQRAGGAISDYRRQQHRQASQDHAGDQDRAAQLH